MFCRLAIPPLHVLFVPSAARTLHEGERCEGNAHDRSRRALAVAAAGLTLLFLAAPIAAQDPAQPVTTLKGIVFDSSSGARIVGALLFLGGENRATFSDSLGAFQLTDVPIGPRFILVRRYGYLERTVHGNVVGSSPMLEIALTRDPAIVEDSRGVAGRTVALDGVVIDATTGTRLRGAAVLLVRENRGVLSDSLGRFRLPAVTVGDHLLLVKQFGYESLHVGARATDEEAPLEIVLRPEPLMLDGLTVEVMARNVQTMETQIRSRRNAAAVYVRALDQDRLLRSAASDMLEFLKLEAALYPVGCVGRASSANLCIMRRGLPAAPTVFIDEIPAFGGLEQLLSYRPQELYLVEVWSSGATIRAYTHQFMERMARRPIQLIW